MKKLVLGTLLSAALAACGGEDDTVTVVDGASEDAAAATCDPLAEVGEPGACAANQKCTWVTAVDEAGSANDLGFIGCVANGDVPLGGDCMEGPAGQTTGFDDCVAGTYCISGTCQAVCGLDGQPDSGCDDNYACGSYSAVFANGGETDQPYGICDATCDPLTQKKDVDDQPCPEGRGCFASPYDRQATCAPVNSATNVNNVEIDTPFINACAPGFYPRPVDANAEMWTWECGGFCKAADVHKDTPGVTPADGVNDGRSGRPNYESGDATASNWMSTIDTPVPATCGQAARYMAENPDMAEAVVNLDGNPGNPNGESCMYFYAWSDLVGGDPVDSPLNNGLGVCFQLNQMNVPWNAMLALETTPWPSCLDLDRGPPAAELDGEFPDTYMDGAADFGCIALSDKKKDSLLRTSIRNARQWEMRHWAALKQKVVPARAR